MKRLILFLALGLSLVSSAQEEKDSSGKKWNFSAWAEQFILPGEEDFFNPTFYARTKKLHFEGRYNYEDRNTASLWAGRRISFGGDVKFLLVPMAGIVIGNIDGIAPGLEAEVAYKKLDLYLECEYVFDINTSENNFFYMYSELAFRPIKPFRTGLITQRT